MGVIIIDGSTVRCFVHDEAHFKTSVDAQFTSLDANDDGVLSLSEMRNAFESMRVLENHFGFDRSVMPPEELTKLYDSVFMRFDRDHSGSVDKDEFRSEMKKIMLEIADRLGSSPIKMVIEDDDEQSLLNQAADLEAAKVAGGW
uniref:uncharacterized protein LOC122593088 n=1 Tax=Erigeron canadensis TaxID=72917 RepID=UPI001CB93B4E|nr:uncharacterized protein LOC122593088 [Erigeron canadensis]